MILALPVVYSSSIFCHRVSVSFVVVCFVSKEKVLINKVYKIVARLGLGVSLFWAVYIFVFRKILCGATSPFWKYFLLFVSSPL